jgi:type II restriction enzyme
MSSPSSPAASDPVSPLIARWREDPDGTYQAWFLWEERLKNFRSIRRGIGQVVAEIESGTFGNVYKGSSLETVVGSIAEQRQIFKGADHAFLWKPKLRIPDIYENREHQLAFGRFLDTCACCTTEDAVLDAIRTLDRRQVKGLGPAAANLLYFLHPTFVPPFNTAIVKGYNGLTGARVRLGRWDDYLAMRAGMLELNAQHRSMLSNDLGAVAGLLFDLGTDRYAPPPRTNDAAARQAWEADLARVRQDSARAERVLAAARDGDRTHTEIQGWLRDLGRALGFSVWVAANDRSRSCGDGRLGDGCLDALPPALEQGPGGEAVRLIDVIWISPADGRVAGAFEVEHTTSIYSGIVRLLDLALGSSAEASRGLYLVAPDQREADVRAQLARPAFSRVGELRVRFLPYSELEQHRHSMARFGQGMKAIEAVARSLS